MELASLRERTSILVGPGRCYASGLDFSADGKLLALSTQLAHPSIWDVATGRQVDGYAFAEQKTDGFRGGWFAAFSPDGKTLAVNGVAGEVDLWDTATERKKATLRASGIAKSAAFSPDGATIAIGGTDRVTLVYELASGRLRQSFKGHGEAVAALAFSPEGRFLATTGKRDVVRLWDLRASPSPEIIRVTAPMSFWPTRQTGAISRRQATGPSFSGILTSNRSRLHGPPRSSPLAFSPDGRMLASLSERRNVTVHEVGTGIESKRMRAKVTWVDGNLGGFVVFSPDGRRSRPGTPKDRCRYGM